MLKSQLVSGLVPGTVSDADVREQSGKSCPAAHQGTHPPRGFAPCSLPVPGGSSQRSATPTATPMHLLRPLSYSFAQPSVPVPPARRPAAGFHEGHPGALPHSSHDSATPLSEPGTWTRPPAPEGTCVAASQPAVKSQPCSLFNSEPQPHVSRSPEPQVWSDMGKGDLERVSDSHLLFTLQKEALSHFEYS